jgi:hypothetical protein
MIKIIKKFNPWKTNCTTSGNIVDVTYKCRKYYVLVGEM